MWQPDPRAVPRSLRAPPGCGRTCWQDLGVLQRGLSPRVGRGPCSSAAPAGGPGCPCWCPARARPFAPPGTRINCSYFPSLTALLLAGTNCESPQGRTAHPARDVPPTPGLCYPEFRISCSRLGDQGSRGGCPGWSKEAVDMERGWNPFPLGTSGLLSTPQPGHKLGVPTSWGSP